MNIQYIYIRIIMDGTDTELKVKYNQSTGTIQAPWDSEYTCVGWGDSSNATTGVWSKSNVQSDLHLWAIWKHNDISYPGDSSQLESWSAGDHEMASYTWWGENRKIKHISVHAYGGVYSMWADKTLQVKFQIWSDGWITIGDSGQEGFGGNFGSTRTKDAWVDSWPGIYCQGVRVVTYSSEAGKGSWFWKHDGNLYGGYENLYISFDP
mgnify:CR=1 FL=1